MLLGLSGNLRVDSGVIWETTSLFTAWMTCPLSREPGYEENTERVAATPLLYDTLHEEENTKDKLWRNLYERTTSTDAAHNTSIFMPKEHAQVHSKHVKSIRENKETYDGGSGRDVIFS